MSSQLKQAPLSLTRLRIPKGSDLLAQQIRAAIVDGGLEAGDMLPSEKALMAQLGLSRATVREGLRLLEADGLITTRPGRGGGATVQRPGQGGHLRSLAMLLQFDGTTRDELSEAWSALVPVCGRLAASRRTPGQLAELREHLLKMEQALDNSSTYIRLEVSFHMLVAHATNNAVLRIYGTSLAELTYHQIQSVPFARADMESGLSACQAILASIEAGDGERAEHRIARHLEAVEANIQRLLRPQDGRSVEMAGVVSRLSDAAIDR